MAWLDDRAWCHPKLVNLTDRSFRVHINAISYSAGMGLRGTISPAQQKLLGADKRVRRELVTAGLWVDQDGGTVCINDWDEHNGRRDDRRAKDRERKRQARKTERQSAGTSAGQSQGTSRGTSTRPARVEGSEGSEGSDKTFLPSKPREDGKDGRIENGNIPDLDHVLREIPA